MQRRPPSSLLVLAGLTPVLAAPVVAYELVGDQLSTTAPNPDYFIRPLALAPSTVTTIALGATAAAMLGLGVLVPLWKAGALHPLWKKTLVCLVTCGILLGVFYRVATAAVIGANIGAGVMILFAGPAFLALLFGALFTARKAINESATAAVP